MFFFLYDGGGRRTYVRTDGEECNDGATGTYLQLITSIYGTYLQVHTYSKNMAGRIPRDLVYSIQYTRELRLRT